MKKLLNGLIIFVTAIALVVYLIFLWLMLGVIWVFQDGKYLLRSLFASLLVAAGPLIVIYLAVFKEINWTIGIFFVGIWIAIHRTQKTIRVEEGLRGSNYL